MTPLGRPDVYLDIVEQHFEELDFLWEQREGVVFAPDWTLPELAELENRARAHLDGLLIAESHAVELARPALTGDETFAAVAATLVFMESGVPELADEVLEALTAADGVEPRDGIRIGLRQSRIDGIRGALIDLASGDDAGLAGVAADVLAFHRVGFPIPRHLLEVEDPAVRALACGAIGRLGEFQHPGDLETAFGDLDPKLRRAALHAAAMSGMRDLSSLCRRLADDQPEALAFLGILGDRDDLPLIAKAARDAERTEAAIEALGALGAIEAVPFLLDAMRDEGIAQAAGAAFTRIGGAEAIEAERPEPGAEEEGGDEETLDETDPPPDLEKAKAWWESNKGRFAPDGRWQAGLNVDESPLREIERAIPLLARRDAYLRLWATSSEEEDDVELEARAVLQMEQPVRGDVIEGNRGN